MLPIAYFEPADDGRVTPTKYSLSLWAPKMLHGPAVCSIAARAAEREFTRDGFRPARFTIDLFRAARTDPTTTTSRLLRDGGRIRVVEVDVVQYPDDGQAVVVARSTTVFVRESTNPPGQRWQRADSGFVGPDVPADEYHNFFAVTGADSGAGATDAGEWTRDMTALQAPVRKRLWTAGIPVVTGEPLTPFVRAVAAAESTSLVTNWGSTGIGFINCDLTVALTRLPDGHRVGVETDSHLEADGISTGTATLYDAAGPFGTGVVVAVNNAAAQIDFTTVDTAARYASE